jgi:hypothetical protein
MGRANFDLDAGETDVVVDGFCTPTTTNLLQAVLGTTTSSPPAANPP